MVMNQFNPLLSASFPPSFFLQGPSHLRGEHRARVRKIGLGRRGGHMQFGGSIVYDYLLPHEPTLPLELYSEAVLWLLSASEGGSLKECLLSWGSIIMELPPPWIFISPFLLLSFTSGGRLLCVSFGVPSLLPWYFIVVPVILHMCL